MRRQRPNPTPVDLGRHGALEKVHRNNQTAFSFDIVQDPFDPRQRTVLDQDSMTTLQKWPRHHEQPGLYHPSNRFDLLVRKRGRDLTESDQINNTGRLQYREALRRVQPAKNISRKKEAINFFLSIRPAAFGLVGRNEFLVPELVQVSRCYPLLVRADSECEPWED
jgi:hypothetical protein